MKYKIVLSIMISILGGLLLVAAAEAQKEVTITVDGEKLPPSSYFVRYDKVFVEVQTFLQQTGTEMDQPILDTEKVNGLDFAHIRKLATWSGNMQLYWDSASRKVSVYPAFISPSKPINPIHGLTRFSVLFMISTGIAAAILIIYNKRKQNSHKRIHRFLPHFNEDLQSSAPPVRGAHSRKLLPALIAVIGGRFSGRSFVQKQAALMEQAGLSLRAEEFFAVRILAVAGFSIGGWFFLPMPSVMLPIYALIGYCAPVIYVKRKAKQRLTRCTQQLPAAVGMLSTSLRAGFSLLQAMHNVSKEISGPLGKELNRTLREINFGTHFDEAMTSLGKRLPESNLDMLIKALIVQRSTGGNLAQMLDTIQETMTERIRIQEDLKTLTAQGKMSAWIISLLPLALAFLLNMMNPEYFRPMLMHPLGWLLLGFGSISMLVGWLSIRKLIRIEV